MSNPSRNGVKGNWELDIDEVNRTANIVYSLDWISRIIYQWDSSEVNHSSPNNALLVGVRTRTFTEVRGVFFK